MEWVSYSDLMGETESFLTITLDLSDPVEIHDFAAFFAGMGSQFDDWLARTHPDLKGTARLYVREVRHGSIIADLIPQLDIIGVMDKVMIVTGFAALFSKRVRAFISGGRVGGATKSDLKHVADTIKAVAHDKSGTMRVERMSYREGVLSRELEVEFDTSEARAALRSIEDQKLALDKHTFADRERVLMVFTRSDVGSASVGKRSGELVEIADIQESPLPLIYGSELAEQRIKDEIRDHDSIYHKGFVVDVNITQHNGRNVAYSVTNVHQVIDIG